MWQNAGFCGLDPFYRGLPWEALADDDALPAAEISRHLEIELRWPTRLRRAATQLRPAAEAVAALAAERRSLLREVYRRVAKVNTVGVRVDTQSGRVVGLGRKPGWSLLEELERWDSAAAARASEAAALKG